MNLTDEQKTAVNVGLATWEGWYLEDELWWHKDSRIPCLTEMLPRYCDDLNAINRLEEKLTDEQHEAFRTELWWMMQNHRRFVSASASQRAIALVKALQLTIEGVTQ